MIRVLVSDFSRTILFPRDFTDVHEMNTINRQKIAVALDKLPEEITDDELGRGGEYYDADEVFYVNEPLLVAYGELKAAGVDLRIFTSGFVQRHSGLQERLSIFSRVFNVQENGGHKKTDRKAYDQIVADLAVEFPGIQPAEILFVDDEEANVTAAREAGFAVFQFPKYNEAGSQDEFIAGGSQQFREFTRQYLPHEASSEPKV